jgi:hypothetical protein
MERCEQGCKIFLRSNGQLLMTSQSRASNGLLSGHGKFTKLNINDSEEVLGAALRACLNNRNPGFYSPHMYKEKEAYQAMMAEYYEDRGEVSDKKFFKETKIVGCYEYSDHIQLKSTDNSSAGKGAWLKDLAPTVASHDASNLVLAKALLQALALCIV